MLSSKTKLLEPEKDRECKICLLANGRVQSRYEMLQHAGLLRL